MQTPVQTKTFKKMLPSSVRAAHTLAVAALACSYNAWATPTSGSTPESETLAISKYLKPIPDDQWASIAGAKTNENYDIQSGDTLSGISGRLFGDPRYWPKIWALNQTGITNPHVIRPGNAILFQPGTGTSLPSIGVTTAENAATTAENTVVDVSSPPAINKTIPRRAGRSQEWRDLPKQSWEEYTAAPPSQTDLAGLDRNKRVKRYRIDGDNAVFHTFGEQPKILGQIESARVSVQSVTKDYVVLVTAEDSENAGLSVGSEYTVIRQLQRISGENGSGYAARSLGMIRITEKVENGFRAVVSRADMDMTRGDHLIDKLPKYANVEPTPAPNDLASQTAHLILPQSYAVAGVAQHMYAFIDLGSQNGVRPGMIFRTYQVEDPYTEKKHLDALTYDDADFIVLQSSEYFSVVQGYHSSSVIEAERPLHALTDLSLMHGLKHGDVRTRTLDIDASAAKPAESAPASTPAPEAASENNESTELPADALSETPTAPAPPADPAGQEVPATDVGSLDAPADLSNDVSGDPLGDPAILDLDAPESTSNP